MKYCEASLTLLRTWLLKSELAAVVLSLTLTWGASVSGVFGMNLMTGMRNSPHWFWRVTAFIVISSVAIIAVSYGQLCGRARRGPHIARQRVLPARRPRRASAARVPRAAHCTCARAGGTQPARAHAARSQPAHGI